jgi:hypothetical protein
VYELVKVTLLLKNLFTSFNDMEKNSINSLLHNPPLHVFHT